MTKRITLYSLILLTSSRELKLVELKRKVVELKRKPESTWSPAQYNFMRLMQEPQMAKLLDRVVDLY